VKAKNTKKVQYLELAEVPTKIDERGAKRETFVKQRTGSNLGKRMSPLRGKALKKAGEKS